MGIKKSAMIQSMTGFGGREGNIPSLGKVSVEFRSTNHKALEVVFHLPEGFLSLEDKLKKEIESKIKRGRVTCVINVSSSQANGVTINRDVLKKYLASLNKIKKETGIKDGPTLDTLVNLPGVLIFGSDKNSGLESWPKLKAPVTQALNNLVRTRMKEGRALSTQLFLRAQAVTKDLSYIRARFKSAIKEKLAQIKTDEERTGFLRDTDITEEIERLAFHIGNFKNKLSQSSPIGKELDFIAQEMQREANTMGAKTFDVSISGRVVQAKSQIERLREQLQNIE